MGLGMELNTRDFGKIQIDEGDIVTFKQPVYGFEPLTKYVFLFDEKLGRHFVWMQSVEDSGICFILMEPGAVVEGYAPALPSSVQDMLGDDPPVLWLVTVIARQFEQSTVNLKSPIAVNPRSKFAAQIILEDPLPIRHPLLPIREGE
jgi:flagellar assembly factor FliW